MKWIAPILVYLSVAIGLFVVRNALGALLLFHIAIILSALIAKSNIPIQILFTGHELKWTLLSILLCGSAGFTLYFLWDKFGIASETSRQAQEMGLQGFVWILFIAYFSLANPFVEEYFWRGFLGSSTKDFSISDFLYAGFHGLILMNKIPTSVIVFSLVLLVLAGWMWRQIARIDRGLRAPVLGHMAADFSILIAIYLKLQG